MAAPSLYGSASDGWTDAGGAWSFNGVNVAYEYGAVIILQIVQDGSTSGAVAATSFGSVSNLAGTANSMTYLGEFAHGSTHIQHIWIGRLTALGPSASGTNSTSEDLYGRWYTFLNVNAGTTLAEVIEQNGTTTPSTSSGVSGTVADAGVTTTGRDRLALNFVAIDDDNAQSAFTGETGGDWAEAVAEYAEASGTDGSIGLQTAYPWLVSNWGTPFTACPIYGNSGTQERRAQSFTVPVSTTVSGITLTLAKTGSPTDYWGFTIETDSGGSPSGTTVGSSVSYDPSPLTGTPTTVSVVGLNASLTAGTTYWMVARRVVSRDLSNYVSLYSTETGSYAGGSMKVSNSGTWSTDGTADWVFGISASNSVAGTIDGGTFTNADATDGWGVVGFALIGTTKTSLAPSRPLRHPLIYR